MLTPSDVAECTFHTKHFNGYSTEEVDNFLDQITEDYTQLYRENAVLKSKMKVLVEKINEYRSAEEGMRERQTQINVQAAETLTAAEEEKAAILATLDDEVAERKAQIQQEMAELESQLAAAKLSTRNFIDGMRAMVQQQNNFLNSLPEIEAALQD